MIDQEEIYRGLVESANIGAECREFLSSKVGSYLLSKAQEAEISALRALGSVDVNDKAKIIELQINAKVLFCVLLYKLNGLPF